MIQRVTNQTMSRYAQQNLQSNMERMARLQEAATGRSKIARPSDDPAGTAEPMRARADQRANEQYKRNIDDAAGWLATLDTALGSASDLLGRARDLTAQAGNGAASASAREAIALELASLKGALLDTANTRYMGRTVFAGSSDEASVFAQSADVPAKYEFPGPAGATVLRRIGADLTVRVDADGAGVFGSDEDGSASAFALLDELAAKVRAGEPVGSYLTGIDAHRNAVIAQRS
ncbi:flagellar hook-associated protein FlgL, partial [Arthrobacter deserti]|nr:flagellar hook-associated protein FlgL [Arthrobacter deserti]